jgi:outer membrane protein assembly factor BamE (lipoprotein component of BamABCDE complex)
MREAIFSVFGIFVFVGLYGSYLDSQRRRNIHKLKLGMSEDDVIQILGKPTNRAILDIPGTYWYYRTDLVYALIDDNPDSVGYLVLEMGSNGNVVKIFDLK